MAILYSTGCRFKDTRHACGRAAAGGSRDVHEKELYCTGKDTGGSNSSQYKNTVGL